MGGMSILAGHITAEQLTKFILYSEWLIYSTWWIGDNLSSLMQSVGASEKVFQLMDLSPSDQFTAKGMPASQISQMNLIYMCLGYLKFPNLFSYLVDNSTLICPRILSCTHSTVLPIGRFNVLVNYFLIDYYTFNLDNDLCY